MDVCVVSYSVPETKMLPNPVMGPEATMEAVAPVPPMPPPACGVGPHEANTTNRTSPPRRFGGFAYLMMRDLLDENHQVVLALRTEKPRAPHVRDRFPSTPD